MIKGIGIDIVDINRIERLINKYNRHFLEKVYTPSEIEYCDSKACPAIHYAGRWAAKEAFYKALSSLYQQYSSWKSINVASSKNNKPYIDICSDSLKKNLEKEDIKIYNVSISHERKYCIAIVILG